jgi:hypothetical protein
MQIGEAQVFSSKTPDRAFCYKEIVTEKTEKLPGVPPRARGWRIEPEKDRLMEKRILTGFNGTICK